MHLLNTDVDCGIANCTLGFVKDVKLRDCVEPHVIRMHGYRVLCVEAKDVKHIEIEFEQPNSSVQTTFLLHPVRKIYSVRFPAGSLDHVAPIEEGSLSYRVKSTQFPMLVNNCTTGHKLQGKTKSSLLVAAWSYMKNWPYVMSRVMTLAGFFCRFPIDATQTFATDESLERMLERFKRMCSPLEHDFHHLSPNR